MLVEFIIGGSVIKSLEEEVAGSNDNKCLADVCFIVVSAKVKFTVQESNKIRCKLAAILRSGGSIFL